MTHDTIAAPNINAAPAGSGYLLPLAASIVLAFVWGAYTIWVSLEIISMRL